MVESVMPEHSTGSLKTAKCLVFFFFFQREMEPLTQESQRSKPTEQLILQAFSFPFSFRQSSYVNLVHFHCALSGRVSCGYKERKSTHLAFGGLWDNCAQRHRHVRRPLEASEWPVVCLEELRLKWSGVWKLACKRIVGVTHLPSRWLIWALKEDLDGREKRTQSGSSKKLKAQLFNALFVHLEERETKGDVFCSWVFHESEIHFPWCRSLL